jgi:hypothetical protein
MALVALIGIIAAVAQAFGITGSFIESVFYAIGAVIGFIVGLVIDAFIIIIIICVAVVAIIVAMILNLCQGFEISALIAKSMFIGIGIGFLNLVALILDGCGSILDGMQGAAEGIANLFIGAANVAIDAINGIIGALNMIPGINIGEMGHIGPANFGDWGAGAKAIAASARIKADKMGADLAAEWSTTTSENAAEWAQYGEVFGSVFGFLFDSLVNPFDTAATGGEIGAGIGRDINEAFKDLLPKDPEPPSDEFLLGDGSDVGAGTGGAGGGGAANQIAKDTNDIKNLLERMKDLAERNSLMRFTSVVVNIDMENDIGETDLDGVITYVNDKVAGAMNNSLAGVVF